MTHQYLVPMLGDQLNRAEVIRRGGQVSRYHAAGYLSERQTVGQHTFNMLGLLFTFVPEPSVKLIQAVLLHDVAEAATGDVPAPTRWGSPDLDKAMVDAENKVIEGWGLAVLDLPIYEQNWLRVLDTLEGLLFCRDQRVLGNAGADATFALYFNALKKYNTAGIFPHSLDLHNYVRGIIDEFMGLAPQYKGVFQW